MSENQNNSMVWKQIDIKPTVFFLLPGYRLNDGYWHTVDLAARDNLMTLTIDEEEGSPLKITNPFTIRTGDRYFFGGKLATSNKEHGYLSLEGK